MNDRPPVTSAELSEFLTRATAPGAVGALPSLFAPQEHRDVLAAVFALRGEIGRSLASELAPEVASTRLSWWGEETGRLVAGEARHPLTRCLGDAIEGSALSDTRALGVLVAEMVGAAQATLSEPVPATWDALAHRLHHDWGALCRLLSQLLSPPEAINAPWHGVWGNALGTACAIDEALCTTASDALPALSPTATSVGDAGLRVEAWRQHALGQLATAASALPAAQRAGQRPLLVLANITGRRLVHPPPRKRRHLAYALGELWCAWRGAQQAARGEIPSALRRTAAVDSADE